MNKGGGLKNFVKSWSNVHFQGEQPNIFLFATPRGGSTWFMEMIGTQPGVKYCEEPFNVRWRDVAETLGISSFAALYADGTEDIFANYIDGLRHNKIRFLNPAPFRKNYRPFTNRMLFKVIHAGMDRISWFEDSFKARIVYVLRHPIPVSLSRKSFPLLEVFDHCDLRNRFTDAQLELADRIRSEGDHLEKGVVAWCLHNAIPLREVRDSWAVVTYEQAVLEPEKVIRELCQKLDLPDPQRMLDVSQQASAVTNQSSEERRLLLSAQEGRDRLVSDWRSRVNEAKERELMAILDTFELDAYRTGYNCSLRWSL